MITNETSEIKRKIREQIESVKSSPDPKLKGFKIHVVKAKREGYVQALNEVLKIIEFHER